MNNTDYLAFRCIEDMDILKGMHVLDLGCGSGRSTRFLWELGNTAVGIDTNETMINAAIEQDTDGTYLHVNKNESLPFGDKTFDAMFSSWMILEMGSGDDIVRLLKECNRLLKPNSIAIIITNTPEFYQGKWLSCNVDHPQNKPPLRSGQQVRVTLLPEEIELYDYFWSDADYQGFFHEAGFLLVSTHHPLGRHGDPYPWMDELRVAPYVIYVLQTVTD
jgi:SAM-dependent methyltransferase